MPNIELYGELSGDRMYDNVRTAALQLSLKDEIVITDHRSATCLNLYSKGQPFIRVCSTDKVRIDAIVEVLQPLGYDIETLVLTGFYAR